MAHLDTNQPTAFFVRGPSPLARLIVFGILSIVLMVLDVRLHYLVEVRQGFVALIRPLEVVVSAPLNAANLVGEYLVSQVTLVRENRQLRQRDLHMQADLQRFRVLQQENAHLRNLLGAAQASALDTKLGEIVLAGRDVFTRKVIINIGQRHGVAAGLAVIDEYGVVGQITRAYPFSSEVTLVTDKDLAVPVQVERTGLRAIAFGLGRENRIGLPYLPSNVDIQKGDKLVTSGLDGVYPTGLAVASVERVERSPDSTFARIVCKPLAGTNVHRQVLIVMTSSTPPTGLNIQKQVPESPANAPDQP